MNGRFVKGQKPHNFLHGETDKTTEYKSWSGMIDRCTRPLHPAYDRYGGRGIVVCDRWRESYLSFLEDMGRKPAPNMSLDRIDNSKGYSPDNCRWATPTEQGCNTRKTVWLDTPDGRMYLAQAAKFYGLSRYGLARRLKEGWSVERAVLTKDRCNTVWLDTPAGRITAVEASKLYGISEKTIYSRLERGWSDTDAACKPLDKRGGAGKIHKEKK